MATYRITSFSSVTGVCRYHDTDANDIQHALTKYIPPTGEEVIKVEKIMPQPDSSPMPTGEQPAIRLEVKIPS